MLLRKLTNAIQPKPSNTSTSVNSNDNNNNHAMSGYLKKMGQLNKSFKERYFVLDSVSYKLYYYKSHTSNSAISYIQVDESFVRLPSTEAVENMFELVTAGRIFQLIAPDMDQCHLWCQKLASCSKIEQDNLFVQTTEFKIEETVFKLQKQLFEKEEMELKIKVKSILERKEKKDELKHHPTMIQLSPQQQLSSSPTKQEEEEEEEEDFIPLSPSASSSSNEIHGNNLMTPTFASFLNQQNKSIPLQEEEEEEDSEEEEDDQD